MTISYEERTKIEAFLFLEARLADESQYSAWEELIDDKMEYVVYGDTRGEPGSRVRSPDKRSSGTDRLAYKTVEDRSSVRAGAALANAADAFEYRDFSQRGAVLRS